VFYPIESLPAAVHGAVQFLPLTHAVMLTRSLVAGAELTQPLLHITVLMLYALVSYSIALVLVRRRLLV
jgi:lipooligosaccharide transport system permease protein